MNPVSSVVNRMRDVLSAAALLSEYEATTLRQALGEAEARLLRPQPIRWLWTGYAGRSWAFEVEGGGLGSLRLITPLSGVQSLWWLLHLEQPLLVAGLGQSADGVRNAVRIRAADFFDAKGIPVLAQACLQVSVVDGHLIHEPPTNAPRIDAAFF